MSLFAEIDNLASQTDQLVKQANAYKPPIDTDDLPPPPADEGPPPTPEPELEVTTEPAEEDQNSSSETSKEHNAGSSGSSGSPKPANTSTDQQGADKWIQKVKQVDPKVWYGIGGGAAFLVLISALKQ